MIEIEINKALDGAKAQMHLEIKLCIKAGEFVTIMGESGAGKSTLLRVLAGLEEAHGQIHVAGISWQGLGVQEREIGFVFQDYALFENMSVEENLLFVNPDKVLAQELLEATELTRLKNHNVVALSGGQRQRVGLCRAMIQKPKILLMDEPLSALDRPMRSKLYALIKQWHQRFEMTTIMVSHDLQDVLALSTRVLTLEEGKISKDRSLEEMLRPKSKATHEAEVLGIVHRQNQTFASVLFGDMIVELEVSKETKVGELLSFGLNPRLLS